MRAAVYARVSTDEQARDGSSLDNQRERCQSYIDAQGWEFAGEFVDDGVSGAKQSRPALDRLMAACQSGEVEAVVVTKLDRFGRSARHLTASIGDLDDYGVTFVSLAEAFDSTNPAGRLMRTMLGGFAEFERDQIRDRMMSGQRAMAEAGFWPAGPPPHGYRIVPDGAHKRLAVDDHEAEGIRLAASVIVDEGGSVGDATIRLTALGFRRRRGSPWTRNHLRRRLTLDHYTGRWVWRAGTDSPVVFTIPPILTPERQAALHSALAAALNAGRPRASYRRHFYALSGTIFGLCGAHYSGVTRADRNSTRFYRCKNRNVHAIDMGEKCDDKWLHAEDAEFCVFEGVDRLFKSPESLLAGTSDRLFTGAYEYHSTQHIIAPVPADQIADLDRRIAAMQRGLGDTVGEYLRAGVDAAAVKEATSAVEAELAQLRTHRANLDAWRDFNNAGVDRMAALQELVEIARYRLANLTPEQQRHLYDLLELRVEVMEHGPCATCAGTGRRTPGPGRPACGACRGTGAVPRLHVTGTIYDARLRAEWGGDVAALVRRGTTLRCGQG